MAQNKNSPGFVTKYFGIPISANEVFNMQVVIWKSLLVKLPAIESKTNKVITDRSTSAQQEKHLDLQAKRAR